VVDSAPNRDEYQEYFLGGIGGRCVELTTLPPSCAVVLKSVSLNLLETSGPVQACNGNAYLLSKRLDIASQLHDVTPQNTITFDVFSTVHHSIELLH